MKKLNVRKNKILGKCIDIMRNWCDASYPFEMGVYLIYADNRYEQIEGFAMSDDDIEFVTGESIEKINTCNEIEIAKMIAENSHPYGFGEKQDIYDYFSAGLTVYQDAIPHKL